MTIIPIVLITTVLGLLVASLYLTISNESPETGEMVVLRWIFLGSLLLRLLVAIGSYYSLPYGYFAPDEIGYFAHAEQLAGHPLDLTQAFVAGGQGWFYFNAFLIQVFGVNRLEPRLWNAGVGALTPVFGYLLAKRLGAHSGATWSAILLAVFPSLVLWSSLNLKDVDVQCLILASLLAISHLHEAAPYRRLLSLVPMIGVLYTLRQYTVVALATAIAVAILAPRVVVPRQVAYALASVGVAVVAAVVIVPSAFQTLYVRAGLDKLAIIRHNLSAGARSAVDADPGLQTLRGAIAFLPRGLIDLLLRPFPWEQFGGLRPIVVPETILYYAILVAAIVGLAFSRRFQPAQCLPLLAFFVVLSIGYALVLGNLGTSYRERAQLLVVMIAFAGVGVYGLRTVQSGLVRSRGGAAYGKQDHNA